MGALKCPSITILLFASSLLSGFCKSDVNVSNLLFNLLIAHILFAVFKCGKCVFLASNNLVSVLNSFLDGRDANRGLD